MKSLGEAEVKKAEALSLHGPDFIFAVETPKKPALILDDRPASHMRRNTGSTVWSYTARLTVGTSHRFHNVIDGAKFGGSYDVPGLHTGFLRVCRGTAGPALTEHRC